MDYVAFSSDYLYQMADMIRSAIGSLFSVGIYVFMLLLGLNVFLNIIHNISD